MTMRLALIFAAAALAPTNGLAQEPAAAQKDPAASESPPPEMKLLVESCSAHKFETTVEMGVDGKKRDSKVKLCGKEGQTDADWVSTLKDAAKKVEAAKMPQAARDQLITALNAEILKIEAANAANAASAPPAATAPSAAPPPEYATLPPLPTAPVAATNSSRATPAAAPRKPRLTIYCSTQGELGGGAPCISLERETLLTIRADEDLTGGTALRFLRKGNARGEVALAQMRQGQSLRIKLPAQVCAGVASSKVEIQILGWGASETGANQVVETLGPFQLRC